MKYVFDSNDYTQLRDGETYKDKFVILSTEQFKDEYKEALCQLFLVQSGFGCDPTKIGGEVCGRLYDEIYQTRREYILGVATEEAIQEWEKIYKMSRSVFKEPVCL